MTTVTTRYVPITWDELLRTPERKLRRLLSDKYRKASTERALKAQVEELGRWVDSFAAQEMNRAIDAEVARIEARSARIYEGRPATMHGRSPVEYHALAECAVCQDRPREGHYCADCGRTA